MKLELTFDGGHHCFVEVAPDTASFLKWAAINATPLIGAGERTKTTLAERMQQARVEPR